MFTCRDAGFRIPIGVSNCRISVGFNSPRVGADILDGPSPSPINSLWDIGYSRGAEDVAPYIEYFITVRQTQI